MSTIAKPVPAPALTGNTLINNDGDSALGSQSKAEILSQTTHRRDEATKLLSTLLDAKKVSERNMASIKQDDLLKRVTGQSSMDNAIDSTRKLIDSFNRVIDDLRRNLSEDDLAAG